MSSRPREGPPLDEEPERCAFCMEKPAGPAGHQGLALEVNKLPPNVRTLICVSCFFCGTRWARRRLAAKQFDWVRVVG